jgi:hypothetical protein
MHHIASSPDGTAYTCDDLDLWADDLARIRDVARRRRLLGTPDIALELGCIILECRLDAMRQEVER